MSRLSTSLRDSFLDYTGTGSAFPSRLKKFLSFQKQPCFQQGSGLDSHFWLLSPGTECFTHYFLCWSHTYQEHVTFAAFFPPLLGHQPKSQRPVLGCILNLFCRKNQNELLRERQLWLFVPWDRTCGAGQLLPGEGMLGGVQIVTLLTQGSGG